MYYRRRRLKGIHSRSDTNRTGAEGSSFYYPRLLHCLDQMLAVMSLSQHRVSSSKTHRPRAQCGARCIGHTVSIWSAVCSEVPHLQCTMKHEKEALYHETVVNIVERFVLLKTLQVKNVPKLLWFDHKYAALRRKRRKVEK